MRRAGSIALTVILLALPRLADAVEPPSPDDRQAPPAVAAAPALEAGGNAGTSLGAAPAAMPDSPDGRRERLRRALVLITLAVGSGCSGTACPASGVR